MGSQIEDFLNQKMDRKEFLKNVAAGVTAVVGLGMITRAFQSHMAQQGPQAKPLGGYGSSAYGGSKAVSAQPPVASRKIM
jgi:hypothetical protein